LQPRAARFIAHTEARAGAEVPRFGAGFLEFRCGDCGHDKPLAFSCEQGMPAQLRLHDRRPPLSATAQFDWFTAALWSFSLCVVST
jgi:hypothetical protein